MIAATEYAPLARHGRWPVGIGPRAVAVGAQAIRAFQSGFGPTNCLTVWPATTGTPWRLKTSGCALPDGHLWPGFDSRHLKTRTDAEAPLPEGKICGGDHRPQPAIFLASYLPSASAEEDYQGSQWVGTSCAPSPVALSPGADTVESTIPAGREQVPDSGG